MPYRTRYVSKGRAHAHISRLCNGAMSGTLSLFLSTLLLLLGTVLLVLGSLVWLLLVTMLVLLLGGFCLGAI